MLADELSRLSDKTSVKKTVRKSRQEKALSKSALEKAHPKKLEKTHYRASVNNL
jgi:hypothetical protein